MFQPYNLEHAQEFESICREILKSWRELDILDRARERLENSDFYLSAKHSEYIIETIKRCDADNYDYFMEKSVIC